VPLAATGTIGTRFLYAGRDYDADTELYYYRARWYDPQARRFISEDPIGLNGGINLYAYVGNNPINAIDPFGYLTIIVPGTWNIHNDWEKSDFRKLVEKTFGETAIVIDNPNMGNNKLARTEAAKKIQNIIRVCL